MTKENIAPAKAKLTSLVNKALAGEEVLLCKDGVPVVRLVPVEAVRRGDPCRPIPALAVRVTRAAVAPLGKEDWGDLAR